MSESILFDIETDGLNPTQIHCIGILSLDTLEYQDYYKDTLVDGIIRIDEAGIITGHNVKGFDCLVIERLTEGLVHFDYKNIIDTLDLSRALMPGLPNHKLKTWGHMLGYPKFEFDQFATLTDEMLLYMKRDILLNYKVFKVLTSLL